MLSISSFIAAALRLWRQLYIFLRRSVCCWVPLPSSDPTEQERLLLRQSQPSHDQSFESFASDTSLLTAESSPRDAPEHAIKTEAQTSQQTMYVMRHGHRQDEEDREWSLKSPTPWDPPLSDLGRKQARQAGVNLKGQGIRLVVTSPFVRCLQTSAEIVAELGLQQGQWLVHWGLCEVCGPRPMHSSLAAPPACTPNSELREWMWPRESFAQALDRFIEEEQSRSKVHIRPEPLESPSPIYPETLQGAFNRYDQTLREFMLKPGSSDLILVTHGEAVGRSVALFESSAVVYEVTHTGHTRLKRTRADDGKWQQWQLDCMPMETGVSWYLAEGED